MQRITISIDETLGATFDRLVEARGYQSRSEGVRDLVREAVESWESEAPSHGKCVGNLSYVYNRQTRALAQRLSELRHDAHDLVITATQMPLDHEHTLESVMLRGEAGAVRIFADKIRSERGVRFGSLNLISVDGHDDHHDAGAHSHTGHVHLSPRPG